MEVSASAVKALREKTGAGVMDCKKALIEANGDLEAAEEILRKKGTALAAKKVNRETRQGLVDIYLHSDGRIGAMVEVNCESDFVARTPDFKELAHNLAMQVAAMTPKYVQIEDSPPGSNNEDPKEAFLLLQPYIKDPTRTIQDVITEVVAKVGENIRVRRFARFELGD
ncbi:MAG: translation elongation factor Ts [Chloroflexi bacterium]|nr:translation elongation factor Ts [Chloroflexota bacterium]